MLKFLQVSVPTLVKILLALFHSPLIIFVVNASTNAADTKIQTGFLPGFSNHPATNSDAQSKTRTPPSLLKFIGPEGKYVPGYKVPHLQTGAQFGCPSGVENIGGLTRSC